MALWPIMEEKTPMELIGEIINTIEPETRKYVISALQVTLRNYVLEGEVRLAEHYAQVLLSIEKSKID